MSMLDRPESSARPNPRMGIFAKKKQGAGA